MKNETVVIDLDNTICTESNEYENCIPKEHVVEALTKLRENGNLVIINTDRSVDDAMLTIEWLKCHGVPYDCIQFGKPKAKIYIDDNAYKFKTWGRFMKEVYEIALQSSAIKPIEIYERALYANLKIILDDGGNKRDVQIKKAMKQARKVAAL